SVLGGLPGNVHGNMFLKLPASHLLRRPDIVMKTLVSVLGTCQLHNTGNRKRLPVAVPERSNEVAVQPTDELNRDLFRTYRFAFPVIRTTAEQLVSHRGHHAERSLIPLRLALRKGVQMSEFSRGKKHRRS